MASVRLLLFLLPNKNQQNSHLPSDLAHSSRVNCYLHREQGNEKLHQLGKHHQQELQN